LFLLFVDGDYLLSQPLKHLEFRTTRRHLAPMLSVDCFVTIEATLADLR